MPPNAMAARQPARRAMVPNDGHEIRIHVTERKISGGTRSVDGRDCRNAFLGVMRTTPKRGIVFFGRLVIDATFPTTRLNHTCADFACCRALHRDDVTIAALFPASTVPSLP
jgi:hypothetical protein